MMDTPGREKLELGSGDRGRGPFHAIVPRWKFSGACSLRAATICGCNIFLVEVRNKNVKKRTTN